MEHAGPLLLRFVEHRLVAIGELRDGLRSLR